MFVFKLKLTRNHIISAGCMLIALLAIVMHFCTFAGVHPAGKTAEQRRMYLERLGYATLESETHREVVIPGDFDMVYTSYNNMQKKADFNLSEYKGLKVGLYTYKLKPLAEINDIEANLLVYRGKIIGGDIFCSRADGFCLPLVKCEENLKEIGYNAGKIR